MRSERREAQAERQRQKILGRFGAAHPSWKGGRGVHNGYIAVKMREHPKAGKHEGYIGEHILVAEAALGHYLPDGVEIHHFDGNRANNINSNLVICQDTAYRHLLHRRQRAYADTGHADWLRCSYCKTYADPATLHVYPDKPSRGYHVECRNIYQREYRARKRAAGCR